MKIVRVILALIFFASFSSYAAITVSSVSGASNFADNVIFAGLAGADCSGSNNGTNEGTCSNCTGTSFNEDCNDTRIQDAGTVVIKFKSDTVAGNAALGDETGKINTGIVRTEGSNGASIDAEVTVTATWLSLCTFLGNASCDFATVTSKSISVGIDGNGDGDLEDTADDKQSLQIRMVPSITAETVECTSSSITSTHGLCGFEVYPGDEKVFLKTLVVPSSFPNGNTISYTKLRFYFEDYTTEEVAASNDTALFGAINHNSQFFEVTVTVEDSGETKPGEDHLPGLTNGMAYYFRAATVDQAGNVGFHTPMARSDGAAFHATGAQSATPDAVFALLSDDVECFIATAAFNSSLSPHVQALRVLRDRWLKPSRWGRALVNFYYRHSPTLAAWLNQHPTLKPVVRTALWPVVALAYGSFYGGWWFALGSMVAMMIALLATFRLLRRRRLT